MMDLDITSPPYLNLVGRISVSPDFSILHSLHPGFPRQNATSIATLLFKPRNLTAQPAQVAHLTQEAVSSWHQTASSSDNHGSIWCALRRADVGP